MQQILIDKSERLHYTFYIKILYKILKGSGGLVQWILRLQNWLRLESYKKMFHTLREKTGSLSATGGVLCRRHPSAGLPDARAVCRDARHLAAERHL